MEERNGTFTTKLSSAALSYLNAHFLKCEHFVSAARPLCLPAPVPFGKV